MGHSFIQAISIAPLLVLYNSEALPAQHGYFAGISRRSATGDNKELAQGPYVAAREGFEPMTLRTKGVDSTNAPHTHLVLIEYSAKLLWIIGVFEPRAHGHRRTRSL